MEKRKARTTSGDKTICLPMPPNVEYPAFVEDTARYRAYLDQLIEKQPELFPAEINQGYCFHGFVESDKLHLRTRRIRLNSNRQAYQLRPDTVMPYMIGYTEEVEKGLYLRRYGVPYEAIAHVLGHSAMYWYQATQALGRISIVGATVKKPSSLPPHLVADEKHSWWLGQRIYIAVTAAKECFLGVSLAMDAGAEALTQAYGVFHAEVIGLNPDYSPKTVNTDGWGATQTAWRTLFPNITLILCFLHTVLGVQQRCRREPTLFKQVTEKLWHLFHSETLSQFGQRLRRIHEWAKTQVTNEAVRQKLLALKSKAVGFRPRFTFPEAYRTSNQVDRLINIQDRLLYQMQYFHGTQKSANLALRAIALLWNFHPYCQKIQADCLFTRSPFRDLNGFSYHNHWLRNLLIASSLNGRSMHKSIKHKLI